MKRISKTYKIYIVLLLLTLSFHFAKSQGVKGKIVSDETANFRTKTAIGAGVGN